VRNRGYSTEEDTVTTGLSSVAQIVVDHAGYPTAAVAVTYLTDGVDQRTRSALVTAVSAAADQLSRRLGFRSPADLRTGG
jgi:DNA-binding IclR family transcriptional regulator